MPNWTYNDITASPRTIQRMKKKYFDENGNFDFNKLIPMPASLEVESGSRNDTDIYCYLSEKLTIPLDEVRKNPMSGLIHNMFSEDWIASVKASVEAMQVSDVSDFNMDEAYERGKVLVTNYQNYGALNWYDWCTNNWGTKWNACETQSNEDEIMFDTAWCSPDPIFEVICRDFPNNKITFNCEYEEGFVCVYENDHGVLRQTEEYDVYQN